ncbi:ribonuclease domain-containing protein [Streptomyces longisporus]|uniref:Uncharacterized protein n=1 Tax=Streptomyces longisporus TaxID=1948 RepID=A0ABN3NCS0_STRLO
MSSSLDTASASDAERRTKRPRLRGRRRILTVASVVLALMGGVIAEAGTASAQPPAAQCPAACYAGPPAGVQQVDWDDANIAATWWANNNIDFSRVVRSGWSRYYRIDGAQGHGWPDAFWGRNWYGFYEPGVGRDQFIYYGGTFNDNAGVITRAEINHGVSSNDAWQSSQVHGNSPYVEYDIDYYGSAGASRNARRLVRNTRSGNVYATFDHYNSFYYLGRF